MSFMCWQERLRSILCIRSENGVCVWWIVRRIARRICSMREREFWRGWGSSVGSFCGNRSWCWRISPEWIFVMICMHNVVTEGIVCLKNWLCEMEGKSVAKWMLWIPFEWCGMNHWMIGMLAGSSESVILTQKWVFRSNNRIKHTAGCKNWFLK